MVEETPGDMTMVNFAASLLEHLCMLAGSTEIRAGYVFDDYLIQAGENRFSGKTPEEAHKKLFKWMLETELPQTREFYQAQAASVEAAEAADGEELIELLTQDGMSDFGKQVEDSRRERAEILLRELTRLKQESPHLLQDVEQLVQIVMHNTTLIDLDVREMLEGLETLTRKDDHGEPSPTRG